MPTQTYDNPFMKRPDTDDFAALFTQEVALLDVRAPLEFEQGAFPGATNLPLMNDQERHQVGLRYKQVNQEAAIELGHELVSGDIKAARVAQWKTFAQTHPEGYLYCFRGGLRSRISQAWLAEAGIEYPRIVGGYKAMRTFLLESLARHIELSDFVLVSGLTGSGKTEVIQALSSTVDLEKLAHHRGSSFGKHATDQPVQINFDNSLAIALLRLHAQGKSRIALEDESRMIGRCALPIRLREKMQSSSVVWLEEPMEIRVERILHDYVEDLGAQFAAKLGATAGFDAFSARLLESLQNLIKRLGGERHTRLSTAMQAALDEQQSKGTLDLHREWIRPLLSEYYDPMYEHQRTSKLARVIFSGDRAAVTEYLLHKGF
ncbi:MAG: tRNA 2-selenouridine(34) synthase MnmH [Candidatus Methylopumilus sp.]|jgi:tRNA 2-selenouridine synthase|nr:tRNA 2-selenouridine(34) synthase MnmH [Candidatus Methylopumilus sp.]